MAIGMVLLSVNFDSAINWLSYNEFVFCLVPSLTSDHYWLMKLTFSSGESF